MICSFLVTLVNLPQFSLPHSRTCLSLTSLPNPITAQPALGLGAHRDVCMCMGTSRQGEHLLGLHLRLWFCSALFLHSGNSSVPKILPSPWKHIWKEKTSHLPNCHKMVPQAHDWASVGSLQGAETQTRRTSARETTWVSSSQASSAPQGWLSGPCSGPCGRHSGLAPTSSCCPCLPVVLSLLVHLPASLCLSLSFPLPQSLPPSLPPSLLSPYPHLSPSVLYLSLSTSIFLGKSNAASSYSTSPF